MTTFTLSLDDELCAIVEARAREKGCAGVEDYLHSLIRADAEQDISPELEAALLKGRASPALELTAADWDAMRAEVRAEFPTGTK